MATYRSLRCDAPNLRIPRPLLSAVHPERRPTNAPLKFMLHTVHLQRASTVLLQHGSPTGSPTGSALRAHCGPRLSGEKRGGRYLPFCFIFAGARGAARAGERTAQPLPRDGRSRSRCEAATEHSAAFALYSSSCPHCILHCILHLDSRRKCAAASRLQGAHHAFSTSRRLLWLCVPLYCAVSPRTYRATCRYSRFALCFL